MNISLLEQYYETAILPLYIQLADVTSGITWKDHGKVGQDTWAHYFEDASGREYILLYEDFPGNEYMADDLTHSVMPCGDETSLKVLPESEKTIDNIFGYFTLYIENE